MTPAEDLAKRKKRQPHKPKVWRARPLACSIRAERHRLGLTQADVSAAVGLSVAQLYQIEKGGETVLSNALKLARFFGKAVEELWHLPEEG